MTDAPKVTELFHGEPRERVERNPLCAKMERCAGIMAQNFADDLAGYIVIGVNKEGGWSLGFAVDKQSLLGDTMLAGLGIGAIQREMLSEAQIKDAMIRNGFVQPDKPDPAS